MYLLYADESGDPGLPGASTYFILSGLVVHESCWHNCYKALYEMRRNLKNDYGIKLSDEIHTTHMFNAFNKKSPISKLQLYEQINIMKIILKTVANTNGFNAYSVIFNKASYVGRQETAFDNTWKTFIQRFENTIASRNFIGSNNANDYGMLFVDNTSKKLLSLLDQMRNYNPIPSRGTTYQAPIRTVVGDIHMVDSKHSYFIQTADVLAYATKQFLDPAKLFKKQGRSNSYKLLTPILCTTIGTNGLKTIP